MAIHFALYGLLLLVLSSSAAMAKEHHVGGERIRDLDAAEVGRHNRRRASMMKSKKGKKSKNYCVQREVQADATGAQEVPAVSTDTCAHLSLEFDVGLTKVEYELSIEDGKAVTQVHLHCAEAGSNGPVVAFLFNVAPVPGPGGVDIDGDAAFGTLTSADIIPNVCGLNGLSVNNIASLFAAIREDLIYVNVHTEANPPGEVRGQIFV